MQAWHGDAASWTVQKLHRKVQDLPSFQGLALPLRADSPP
jgi:hypothetical protein